MLRYERKYTLLPHDPHTTDAVNNMHTHRISLFVSQRKCVPN